MYQKIKHITSMLKERWDENQSLHGVIIFMIILLLSNGVWKLSIYGDDGSAQVLLFNTFDISAPFNFMVLHITEIVKQLLHFFNYEFHSHYSNDICFSNHNYILVVWGCSAIKQAFIFSMIFLFSPGKNTHKLWYVPMGLFLVYAFNILRITLIAIAIENHPNYFTIAHETLKYAFYGVIFLVWTIWDKKFNIDASYKLNTDK